MHAEPDRLVAGHRPGGPAWRHGPAVAARARSSAAGSGPRRCLRVPQPRRYAHQGPARGSPRRVAGGTTFARGALPLAPQR
ncbi:hypothetical protein AMR41_09295 [Hapalosiphon sp. MRB220]|nr:hypothetical protein AMR41_09295 [Hapalosiphon sp. MRB220]